MFNILKSEKHQLPCFIPVLIAIGILLSSYYNYLNYFILLPLALILFLYNLRITISICFIFIGIFCYKLREEFVKAPIINSNKQYYKIIAKIDNITPLEDGHRISLSSVSIANIDQESTPYKIRIKAKTATKNLKINDVVKFAAILSKPMPPYLEDSYNFARDCYFKKIGAVGYSVSDFEVISTHNQNFFSGINNIRNNIQTRVNKVLGVYYGSIATALMINEYSNIDKEILKDLRTTGLAHILSVSGMHLSLVMAIFFFSSRIIINFIPYIALRINSKKYAAFISLLGSGLYLLISGMEVAAIRSFLMTSLIILSIILDQNNSPMRALSFAAIIILILTPENIFHPSFQMSGGF